MRIIDIAKATAAGTITPGEAESEMRMVIDQSTRRHVWSTLVFLIFMIAVVILGSLVYSNHRASEQLKFEEETHAYRTTAFNEGKAEGIRKAGESMVLVCSALCPCSPPMEGPR